MSKASNVQRLFPRQRPLAMKQAKKLHETLVGTIHTSEEVRLYYALRVPDENGLVWVDLPDDLFEAGQSLAK